MSVKHAVVPIDPTTDLETFLNFQGNAGRRLTEIYNAAAYFINGNPLAIDYKVVILPSRAPDIQNTLNDYGQNGWNFVMLSQGSHAIFEQITTRLAFSL